MHGKGVAGSAVGSPAWPIRVAIDHGLNLGFTALTARAVSLFACGDAAIKLLTSTCSLGQMTAIVPLPGLAILHCGTGR